MEAVPILKSCKEHIIYRDFCPACVMENPDAPVNELAAQFLIPSLPFTYESAPRPDPPPTAASQGFWSPVIVAIADEIKEFAQVLTETGAKMMYVAGETGDAPLETTSIIEEIVREQVIEILRECQEQAIRRGVRTITVNDMFFLIRKDQAKTDRLKNFLSWKDVRKSAKDSDDKGDGGDIGADDLAGGPDMPGSGPMVGDATRKATKRARIILPWDIESFYSVQVPEREDEEDEDTGESNEANMKRLKVADERTRDMTREEYVHWSECRQASFTFRKSKRFREWAGFGTITDGKPNDDIIDILGFLTFEMVQTLTEEALKVKREDELHRLKTGGAGADSDTNSKKRKMDRGPFEQEQEGREPVLDVHVREAYRRLQQKARRPKPWFGPKNGPQRPRIQLI